MNRDGSSPEGRKRDIFSQETTRNHNINDMNDSKMYALNSDGVMRSSTRGTDVNIFSESIVEQAQHKKPAFNTATNR